MSREPAGIEDLDDGLEMDEHGELGRKASHVTKACNACKKRKSKCDRQRPSCGPCKLRKEKCEFTEGDRRHHPDRQFVDSLEQRNKTLEDRTKEQESKINALVTYMQQRGVTAPSAYQLSQLVQQGGSAQPSEHVSVNSSLSPPNVSLSPLGGHGSGSSSSNDTGPTAMITSALVLPISPRASPLREEERQLQDPKPKMIVDERGNINVYGATSALQHREPSAASLLRFNSSGYSQTNGSTPGSLSQPYGSNSPESEHSSASSAPPPGQPINYDHTRHLPLHLRISLQEHEEVLLCLFRVLPAHQKHHASTFLHSMRRTLQYISPPTPLSLQAQHSLPPYMYPTGISPQFYFAKDQPISFPVPLMPPLSVHHHSKPLPQVTQHYSPTLHNATLALALPYSSIPELANLEQRREAAQMAKANLETELSLPSLNGVKALGYLASFHAGMSDHALGWQYFGMCVRMAQALGLNLDCTGLVESGDISESTQRERNLAFWSVFVQDKYWSLWFGRAAALPPGSYDIPLPQPDEALDKLPLNGGDGADETTILGCQPAFLSSTFVETCKLTIIASKILASVYGTQRVTDMVVISRLRLELDDWHNKLHPALHYSTTTLSASIPHILTLQMTFNWLIILLDRPFYRSITLPLHQEPAVKRCDGALRRIVRLFKSWYESHGMRYCTVEHALIVFTAGATFLLSSVQFKPLSEKKRKEGVDGVRWCIRLLKDMGQVWPAAKEKASILFKLQKKFFSHVEALDSGTYMETERGDETPYTCGPLEEDPESWAELNIGLNDETIVPQFVVDSTGLLQGLPSLDGIPSYVSTLSPISPFSAFSMRSYDPLHSNRPPALGADSFLTTLYQFMENYETAPQQPQYQAPIFDNAEESTADIAGTMDAPGSPLLQGWDVEDDEDEFLENPAYVPFQSRFALRSF